jgi:hypothetical protein
MGHSTCEKKIQGINTACWITKATVTQSEYVIIVEFVLQQWLRQRVSLFRYSYIYSLVTITKFSKRITQELH